MKGRRQMNIQEENQDNRGMKGPRQMNKKGEWKKNGPQSDKIKKQYRNEKIEKKTTIIQKCIEFPNPYPNNFGMLTIPHQAMYSGMQVPQGMYYEMQIPQEMYYGVQFPQGMHYGMQIPQGMAYGIQILQGMYYGMDPSK